MGIEDSTLEKMTTNLLQVSSVFFIQQNELQAMHQRLSKELTRLVAIQNALSEAAQQHQDAVLQCISNFESLSVHQHDENEERPPARASVSSAPPTSAFDGPNMMASWREPHEEKPKPAAPSAAKHTSPGKGAGASSQSAPPNKKLLLPPVSKALRTFHPQKEPKKEGADEEDEDEGIKYVDKLVLVGGVLGLGLKANGEYVGTPSFQWFRRKMVRGQRLFLPIEGASTDEYVPNADDVNTVLRLECTPPYGGAKLVVDTDEIAVDPSTHQMLSQMLSRGHAEFNCVQANGGEPRILLITLKNIKVRGRLSRLTTSATTIYKQGYEMPLTLVLDPHSPTEVRALHASAHHGAARRTSGPACKCSPRRRACAAGALVSRGVPWPACKCSPRRPSLCLSLSLSLSAGVPSDGYAVLCAQLRVVTCARRRRALCAYVCRSLVPRARGRERNGCVQRAAE